MLAAGDWAKHLMLKPYIDIKDRAKRYHKSSIFNLQSSVFNSLFSGLEATLSDQNAYFIDHPMAAEYGF